MIIRCNYHIFYFIIFYIVTRAWSPQQHILVTACQQYVYLCQSLSKPGLSSNNIEKNPWKLEAAILEVKLELSLKKIGGFHLHTKFQDPFSDDLSQRPNIPGFLTRRPFT